MSTKSDKLALALSSENQELRAQIDALTKRLEEAGLTGKKTRAKRDKKDRDPLQPKKPKNSYFLFSDDRRAPLKEEQPELKGHMVSKQLSEEYKALDEKAMAGYKARAQDLKDQYTKDMEAYKKTIPSSLSSSVSVPTKKVEEKKVEEPVKEVSKPVSRAPVRTPVKK